MIGKKNKEISENIKFYREAAGLTQYELAEKSGFSQQQISFWESGKNEPMPSALVELGHSLGIEPSRLLKMDGSVVVEFFVGGRDIKRHVFQRGSSSPKVMKKELEKLYGVGQVSIITFHPNISAPLLVANNVRRLRRIFNMSSKDLAHRSGLAVSDIEYLESGNADIDYDNYNENNVKLDKIAASFNTVGTNNFLNYCE
jgi:transcriptional regulator with XRE-family HTH domain